LWSAGSGPANEQGDSLQETLNRGFYSLLYLAQTLQDQAQPVELTAVTTQAVSVGGEPLLPEKATILGPCRAIPLEYDHIRCRLVDIEPSGAGQTAALLAHLLGELTAAFGEGADGDEPVVVLRGHQRWVEHFTPVALPPAAAQPGQPGQPGQLPLPRPGGTYLITGGLGGLGLAAADYLLQATGRVNLVLLGRSALPPRPLWPQLLAGTAGDEESEPGYKLRQVQRLEAQGAAVLCLAADVTDRQQMEAAVRQAVARFGPIHGAIHAAGVPGKQLIQFKTPETAAPVLAPKINGTLILEQVLRGQELDFLLLFSSIASYTAGGPGQVDYCAANAFLDAYARQQQGQKRRTVAVNWGEWQWNAWEAEQSGFSPQVQQFFRQNRAQFGIHAAEGRDALGRILACHFPQIIVSTQPFPRLVQAARQLTIANLLGKHGEQLPAPTHTHTRPNLSVTYIAPRNELEEQIAAVWEEALAVVGIGIDDNFFELGGNSLIGLTLIRRLQQVLALPKIPDRALYEAPTIRTLAQSLGQPAGGEAGAGTAAVNAQHARGQRRRQQYAGRMQARVNHG
jgi:NAD(P)-dependent dehydrogenase (short-subunit alcohol dehydrogenase family)